MSSNLRTDPYSSTSNDTSTLRPRTTRLVSYLGQTNENESSNGEGQVTSTSSASSRRHSPSSSVRNAIASRKSGGRSSQTDLAREGADATSRTTGANGLWGSWNQIQGIASTFLGSDTSAAGATSRTKASSAFKTPAWMKQDRSYGSSKQTQKWGPHAPDKIGIGPGSIEERQAMLQAKKREALLLAATDQGRDASGRFKRKGSNSSLTIHSAILSDDVLVYRHKVLPHDTMAGVTIKYSCQQDIFRKVNRLWPNDRIQLREHVFLPVDACAIHGRKVDRPNDVDLLGEAMSRTEVLEEGRNGAVNGIQANTDGASKVAAHTTASSVIEDQDEDYKHDSWVILPSFPRAIEILRISRIALGYFPPARRKSNHNLQLPVTGTAASSPRTSFDTLRHPPSHAAQQAQLHQQSLRTASADLPYKQPLRMSYRHRSHSTATTSSQQTNHTSNTFFSALQGPGGVGSLRGLRTESSRPGPAEDSLNQNFAKYLPSLALTTAPVEDVHLDSEQRGSHTRAMSSSQALRLPRTSMESLRSSRSGRSNSSASAFGGVENWVKKIATATNRPMTSRTNSDRTIGPGKNTSIGIGIGGETGLGDLIELENSDERGFLPHPDDFDQSQDDGVSAPRAGHGTGAKTRSEPEDLLNERFPIRGRVASAYGAKK